MSELPAGDARDVIRYGGEVVAVAGVRAVLDVAEHRAADLTAVVDAKSHGA